MVGFRLALPADNVAAMLERFGQHFSHQIQQQKMTEFPSSCAAASGLKKVGQPFPARQPHRQPAQTIFLDRSAQHPSALLP